MDFPNAVTKELITLLFLRKDFVSISTFLQSHFTAKINPKKWKSLLLLLQFKFSIHNEGYSNESSIFLK